MNNTDSMLTKETGKSVKLPIAFFIEFDDQGKVQENRVYYNVP